MNPTWILALLVMGQFVVILLLLMKTTELNASVSALAAGVSALTVSVDAAAAALKDLKSGSTPDSDVTSAITNIDVATVAVASAKATLDGALS